MQHTKTTNDDKNWIPVEKLLPIDHKRYPGPFLVTTSDGVVESEMWYGKPYGRKNEKNCFHKWNDEMWHCFIPDVIAWQPYPKPYKKKRETNENN